MALTNLRHDSAPALRSNTAIPLQRRLYAASRATQTFAAQQSQLVSESRLVTMNIFRGSGDDDLGTKKL